MNWGDVPSAAAAPVAVVAAIFSGIALKHGRESQPLKRQAVRGLSDRSAAAAERSATADEAALAEVRREAQERRDAEAVAQRPKLELRVDWIAGARYIVRSGGHRVGDPAHRQAGQARGHATLPCLD